MIPPFLQAVLGLLCCALLFMLILLLGTYVIEQVNALRRERRKESRQ
jgi:hypothetical protein